VIIADCPGTGGRDIPDNTAQRRFAVGIDLSKIVNFVPRIFAQFAEWAAPPKETHLATLD
jgi:hypothetical protein